MEKKGPQHRYGERRLRIIKELVSHKQYDYSKKVRNFLEAGDFAFEDLEHCIFTATVIEKVELDELGTAIDGCKYTIIGLDTQSETFYTCGKLVRDHRSQELFFFITAHEQK